MTQQTIYIGGSETVTVPATESIAVSNFGGGVAKIYYWIVAANVPDDWQYQQSIENEEVVLGPFSVAQLVRIDAGTSKVLFDIGASPATGTPASTLGGLTAAQFVRSDASDDLTGTDYNLNNQTFINGRDTGATERDLIGVDGSDIAQVGSIALPTNINSDGTLTHNGIAVIDADDIPLPTASDSLKNVQVNSDGDGYELCGPLTSFKNKIINGNFDLWDYATSQTSSGYGSDNRWRNEHSGSTKTHSRQAFTIGQTDVPGNPEFFSRTVVTTGGGASNYVRKTQRIEFVKTLSSYDAVCSIWAKADSSKDIAFEFVQNFGTTGSPSAEVTGIGVTTLNLTSSWQKFTITASITSISGKTLGTDLNDYIEAVIWFDAGSDFDARTNSLGNQSGTFDIARVQTEEGPVATQFDGRSESQEISLAERFYWTGYAPGTATGQFYSTAGTTRFGAQVCFPSTMRTTPTVTASGGTYNNCSLDTIVATPTGFSEVVTVTATGLYRVRNNIYYADAEI